MMATILIVEDDGLIVLGLQRQLTDLGHTVLRPADSAAVALAMARVFQPNAVFMDLQLPGDTDGLTVGGMIEAAGIPVIYLSDSPCAPPTAAHQGAAPLLLLKTPLAEASVASMLASALRYGTLQRRLQALQQAVVENRKQMTILRARVKGSVQRSHELRGRLDGQDTAPEEEPPTS
jgi:CheY-like chemotaxis protein